MNSIDITKNLANFLDTLFDLASTEPVESFKDKVFQELNEFFCVDAGIWFSRSDMERPVVEYWQEDTHLYSLPEDFMGNYQNLVASSKEVDPFHELVLSKPDEVVLIKQAYKSLSHWQETIYFKKHSGLYDLKDVMTVLAMPELGRTQTTHVISLYRKSNSGLFTEQDKQLFGFLYPLLREAFRINLFSMVNDKLINGQQKGLLAVADRYGLILEADKDFEKILNLDPDISMQNLIENIKSDNHLNSLSDNLQISAAFTEGLFFIRILPSKFIGQLNSQQRELCSLIRQGHSDTFIGERLQMSHRQVRYLIEQTFSNIGISNRNNIFILLIRFGIE